MANPLRQQIEQISREKNINPEIIIAAIEDAILTASKKYFKNDEDLRSRFRRLNREDRDARLRRLVDPAERRAQFLPHREVHGVGLVGPVQRDGHDAFGERHLESLVVHRCVLQWISAAVSGPTTVSARLSGMLASVGESAMRPAMISASRCGWRGSRCGSP